MTRKLKQGPSSAIGPAIPSPDKIIHAGSWCRNYKNTRVAVPEMLKQFEHDVEVTKLFALHWNRKSGTHPCSFSMVNDTDVQNAQGKPDWQTACCT
jgi:hypothetical protein